MCKIVEICEIPKHQRSSWRTFARYDTSIRRLPVQIMIAVVLPWRSCRNPWPHSATCKPTSLKRWAAPVWWSSRPRHDAGANRSSLLAVSSLGRLSSQRVLAYFAGPCATGLWRVSDSPRLAVLGQTGESRQMRSHSGPRQPNRGSLSQTNSHVDLAV